MKKNSMGHVYISWDFFHETETVSYPHIQINNNSLERVLESVFVNP